MSQHDYTATFLIDQTPTEVFHAVIHVRGWWSEMLHGDSAKLNNEFEYEHKPYHYSKQKLIEVVPDQKVVWLVTDSDLSFTKNKSEWTGTKISFEITIESDKTKLHFTHHGLVPETECYTNCSGGWNHSLRNSLLPLITTGMGRPDRKEK